MNNILNYILGGLLVVAILVGGGFYVSNSSLEKELLAKENSITTLTVQRDGLQIANEGLKAGIDTQNKSLAKLGEIQSTVAELFTNFNQNVTSTNKKIADVKDAISKEKPPATCADTIKYLKDARKEFK